jgi:hypothetical protein
MATRPHIFNRLRALSVQKGQSLSALIEEACDVGQLLIDAADTVTALIADRPNLQNDDEIWAAFTQCVAALHRARSNGHTPENGAKAA